MKNKNTYTFLIHYDYTDELADFLIQRGKHIVCISYGYDDFMDLIIWEE